MRLCIIFWFLSYFLVCILSFYFCKKKTKARKVSRKFIIIIFLPGKLIGAYGKVINHILNKLITVDHGGSFWLIKGMVVSMQPIL